jgi:hypothetical protein
VVICVKIGACHRRSCSGFSYPSVPFLVISHHFTPCSIGSRGSKASKRIILDGFSLDGVISVTNVELGVKSEINSKKNTILCSPSLEHSNLSRCSPEIKQPKHNTDCLPQHRKPNPNDHDKNLHKQETN